MGKAYFINASEYKGIQEQACLNCQCQMEIKAEGSVGRKKKFCSDHCRSQYKNRNRSDRTNHHHQRITKVYEKIPNDQKRAFMNSLFLQYARFKCGLSHSLDQKEPQAVIDALTLVHRYKNTPVHKDFMATAMYRCKGGDVYCPNTLMKAASLEDEIRSTGLAIPKVRKGLMEVLPVPYQRKNGSLVVSERAAKSAYYQMVIAFNKAKETGDELDPFEHLKEITGFDDDQIEAYKKAFLVLNDKGIGPKEITKEYGVSK